MNQIPYVNPENIFKHAADYKPQRILCNDKMVREFEARSAEYLGSRYAVATCSCTVALFCIYESLGLRGKRVLLPSFTWRSTADAAMMAGAIPVFGDIDGSLCLDIESAQQKEFDAICATDVFGCPSDYESILETGKPVLFDSAHAFGSLYRGQKIGRYGIHAFSLSPTKVLVANEGGLITCNDASLYETLCDMRRWAGRMTEYNAACALEGLKNLPYVIEAKNFIAKRYADATKNFGWCAQHVNTFHQSVYKDVFLFCNSQGERDALAKYMAERGIETKVYFVPAHQIAKFERFECANLERTEIVYKRSICLPSWPGVNLDFILKTLDDFAKEYDIAMGKDRERDKAQAVRA